MTKPVTIPNTFANSTTTNSLSSLDTNFSVLGTALNDPATYANYGVDSGTVNAMIVTLNPAPSSLASMIGVPIQVKVNITNTGAVTLNLNSFGVINILNFDNSILNSNQIVAGNIVQIAYNGTNYILLSSTSTTAGILSVANGGTGTATGGNLWRNKIINGAMNVWQRATTYALTTTSTYGSADRWSFYQPTSAAGIANRVASGLTGFQYDLKLGRTASSALTNNIYSVQALETANSIDMAGQSVTLSFYAKAGANYSGASNAFNFQVYSGTGTDQSAATLGSWTGVTNVSSGVATLTTSYQRFTVTGSVGSTATQIGIQLFYTPTGTAGADDNVYITGVQLEKGSTATSFEYRPYGTELQLCQRYCIKYGGDGTNDYIGVGFAQSTTSAPINSFFPVTMRAVPSLTGSTLNLADGVASIAVTTVTAVGNQTSTKNGFLVAAVASGLTAFRPYYLQANSLSGYVLWSAEL
jgi:hypothetical protein